MIVVGNALLIVSAFFASAFVVLYAVTAPWWRDEVGRNIMSLMAVIAAVLDLAVVRILGAVDNDAAWFALLRLIVFAFVPVVLALRFWLLWKVQVRDRRRRD